MQSHSHSSSGSTGPLHQPTHLWDYWAVVMKRWWVVLFVALAFFGTAWLVTSRQEPRYRATARLELIPPRVISPSTDVYVPAILLDETYLATQLSVLRMPETIENAINRRGLDKHPDFKGRKLSDIVRMAVGNVEVNRRRGEYLLEVSVVGREKEVLDDIANALVDEFREMQRSETRALRENRRQLLQTRVDNCNADIRLHWSDKQNQLATANFTEETFEREYNRLSKSLEFFQQEADSVKAAIIRDEPTFRQFGEARKDPEQTYELLENHPLVRSHPPVRDLENEIAILKEERQGLFQPPRSLGRSHPEVFAVEQQIQKAELRKRQEIEQYVESFLLEFEANTNRLSQLEDEKDRGVDRLTTVSKIKRSVDDINAQIERKEGEKLQLLKELEPLLASANEEREAVRVHGRAQEPNAPFAPDRETNLLLGGLLGLIGGIALAFLLEYLDDTIRTKDELAKVAEVPLLGIIPNIEARRSDLQKKDLYAHRQPKSTISEAYRGVRTALTLSAQGPMQKAMLLTSAGPREGKTTTAINLATVLAYGGARTLLIDADLRKPRVHKSFDLPNTNGLTNLIVGTGDPLDAVQRTEADRVDVLTSGPIPPNPSELLGRPRMREILKRLREQYDHIIVDTPPIGAVTDAAVLATMVDGVILVVHAGKTRRQIVSRGLEQLRYINARVVGVILNNLRLGRGRYYPGYYHYYYYYASHYGAEEAKPKGGRKKKNAPAAAEGEPRGPA